MKIGVVILAAGSSSRLGYPKQLVVFNGSSLLQHSMAITATLEFDTKVLVLGAKAEEIEERIDTGNFEVVYNENWDEGLSTSIRKGVLEALKFENELDHIVMLLSDQPLITKEKIQELVHLQLHTDKLATFSAYRGAVGVPAVFSRKVFSELKKLKGDQGAKTLLFDRNFEVGIVEFEDGNFDVDTTADVELLKQMEKK